ncbi:MAG TPA: hypothetical protein VGD74_10865 [Vulgatibacter sp.]
MSMEERGLSPSRSPLDAILRRVGLVRDEPEDAALTRASRRRSSVLAEIAILGAVF